MSSDKPKKETSPGEWDQEQGELIRVDDTFMAVCDLHLGWCMVVTATKLDGKRIVVHYKEDGAIT